MKIPWRALRNLRRRGHRDHNSDDQPSDFEQYTFAIEDLQRVRDRFDRSHTFHLQFNTTLMGAMFAIIAFLAGSSDIAPALRWVLVGAVLTALVLSSVDCMAWMGDVMRSITVIIAYNLLLRDMEAKSRFPVVVRFREVGKTVTTPQSLRWFMRVLPTELHMRLIVPILILCFYALSAVGVIFLFGPWWPWVAKH